MSTFQQIRNKVRMLTGRKMTSQLSDTQIDFQVNQYYTQEFPLQFRTLDLRKVYSFITEPNIDVYEMDPNDFESFEPTAYVSGYPTIFVQDRTIFNSMFPDIRSDVFLCDGDGSMGPYSGTIDPTPILKGSVLIYAKTGFSSAVKVVDNREGVLVDLNPDGSYGVISRGTVDYDTGAIASLTFTSIVPNGNEIRAQSKQYSANRPTTIFYFDNKLTLRPVPDKPYEVKIIAYVPPTALDTSNPSAVPDLNEWWEALAYGAAMKIFENNKDFDGAEKMAELLERKLLFLGRREWNYLHSSTTNTIYNLPAGTSNPGFYFGYYGGIW